MTDRFVVGHRTGPAACAGDPGAVIRRARRGIEMVNLRWGLAPGKEDKQPWTVIRSEGRRFPSHRCLIPGSEFFVSTSTGKGRRKWRFTLMSGDFFYFAGIWRPRIGDWPSAYAALTVAANPDVEPYEGRQTAVILRPSRMAWLDLTQPEEALLKPLPARTFHVEVEDGPTVMQPALAW